MTLEMEIVNALREEVSALRVIVESVRAQQQENTDMLREHDKILVRGNGVPSLQETVRTLAKTMNDYLEEVKQEKLDKKKEATTLKWLLIGAGLPLLLAFIGQAVVFYVKIYPMLQTP